MARVTVEDCLHIVPNRFDLVLLAAKRARLLARGKVEPLILSGQDKPSVVALREIAAGLVLPQHMDQVEDDIELERSVEMALAQKPATENRNYDD